MHLIIIGGFLVNQKPIEMLLQQHPKHTFIDINTIRDTTSLANIVAQIASQIKALIHQTQCNNITLIGYSMGGLVAIKLAQTLLVQTKQIILINSTPRFIADQEWFGIKLDDYHRLFRHLEQNSIINFAKYFILLAALPHKILPVEYSKYFNDLVNDSVENKFNIKSMGDTELNKKSNYKNLLYILSHSDLRHELIQIAQQIPTIMFYSQHDILVPYNSTSTSVAQIQQITLPNSTHLDITTDIDHILRNCGLNMRYNNITHHIRTAPDYLQYAQIQRISAKRILEYMIQYLNNHGGVNHDSNSISSMSDNDNSSNNDRYKNNIILDLGSGVGTFTHVYNNHDNPFLRTLHTIVPQSITVMLCDLNIKMLKTSPILDIAINADAHHLPFADDSCDIIISNLMIQWSPNKPGILREIKRILKPSGRVIFTTLLHKSLWQIQHTANTLKFEDLDYYKTICKQNSLQIIHSESWEHTEYFNTARDLMYHFKNTGTNISLPKGNGLGGKNRLEQFKQTYETMRTSDGLPLCYNYGLFIASI
jgi:malonyl-CoA O-methyltransferase